MANAIVQYKEKAKKNSWARWLVGRTMNQNKNNLVAITGKTGSGKTWSAISICQMMSKLDGVPFSVDNIVFNLRELMDLINSGKLKRGSKVIFDEPQISISAREFQSEANRVFNYLVSTFRHRNLTLFFCAPFEGLIDKNTRRLFHTKMETMSINKNKSTCRLKPRFVEYSDFKPEPYRKQMRVMYKDDKGRTKSKKLYYWDVPKPSPELIEEYEEKKTKFTDNLNKNLSERLKKYEEKGKDITSEQKKEERKPLTEKQEKTMRVFANIKATNKYEKAKELLGISFPSINKHLTYAKKKGYTLEEFRKNEQNKDT